MKVVTDFLPNEYKAFVFDLRAAGVLALFVVVSLGASSVYHFNFKDVTKGLENEIRKRSQDIATLENRINSKSYNQGEIKTLIGKFEFIKEAVGKTDFPFLRFYHSFEKSIPIDEATGSRRIAVRELTRTRSGVYRISGVARHWDDLLRFEENLNSSTFHDPESQQDLKNFAGVKMGSWTSTDEGIEFSAEFQFLFSS